MSGALCLTACNLGCTTTGCELTEIAQNQPLIFAFSKDIDLNSVTTASISLRTAAGEEPVGRFLVNANTVTFLPEVRPVGGTTFFGFDPGAVYELRIEAGANNINALRSTSGDSLQEVFTCQLRVTLGVIDVDGLAPRADLLEPRVTSDVERDVLVKLQFSEIIDIGAFFGTNAGTGPIRFLLRRQSTDAFGNLLGECDPNSVPIPLAGAPRVVLDSIRGVTQVTYRSPQRLPGGRCFEVVVTDRVKDLSGRPAQLQTFHLFTEVDPLGPTRIPIVEDFKDESNLDHAVSSGTWGTAVDPDGEGTFGTIGEDGKHGEFRLSLLRQLAPEIINDEEIAVYEMNVDSTPIPAVNTLDGRSTVVTDGVFHFSTFVLPPLTKLVFSGTHSPQIHVRGLLQIDGLIEMRGRDVLALFDAGPPLEIISDNLIGQPGTAGAAAAGAGGAGGNKPTGRRGGEPFDPLWNGQDGEPGTVVAGHAYLSVAQDTGGKGSPMFPADGLDASVQFTLPAGFPFQAGMVANGGGGGGHITPGENGMILAHVNPDPVDRGPEGQGGAGFPSLIPVPLGSVSHEHFLISGAGGGGGGGHPMQAFRPRPPSFLPIRWSSGAGGAGGAGAILLRAGHRLVTGASSEIVATGGSGGFYDLGPQPGFVSPSPGGGGSGGSVVMQCANADETEIGGFIDVRGGDGTLVDHLNVTMKGGDGADGLVRLETPLPVPSSGTIEPPVGLYRTGELVEVDDRVAFQSDWYSTGEFFPPDFKHYKLDVEIGGMPMSYSDDQTVFPGTVLAGPGEAVILRVQGALLDPLTGEPDPLNIRAWRFYVGNQGNTSGQQGLIDDSATGFRFLIVLDRTGMGAGAQVVIKNLTVVFDA